MADAGQKKFGVKNIFWANIFSIILFLPFSVHAYYSHPVSPVNKDQAFSSAGAIANPVLEVSAANGLAAHIHFSPRKNSYLRLAQAQDTPKDRSIFRIDNVMGKAGHRLAIRIELPIQNFSKKASLLFQGVPGEVLLSPGSKVNDVWIVPLIDAPELTMISPYNFEGNSQITVILSEENNKIIEAQKFSVQIHSDRATPMVTQEFGIPSKTAEKAEAKPEEKQVTPSDKSAVKSAESEKAKIVEQEKPIEQAKPQKTKLTTPELTTQSLAANQEKESKPALSGQESLSNSLQANSSADKFQPKPGLTDKLRVMMMEKAELLLSQGDIEGARVNLRFIAERGDVEGALLLAKTFDPVEFKKYAVVGLQPDPVQAKLWYERAEQMGSSKAGEYLKALAVAKK